MAKNGGWNCWSMVLIETRRFETRLEAKRLERFHYEQLNSEFALNMISPQIDAAEYKGLIAYNKDYKEANITAITAQKCVKHACACGGRYTTQNILQHMKTNKHTAYIAQIKK